MRFYRIRGIVSLIVMIVAVVGIVIGYNIITDRQKISDAVKLARLSINCEDLAKVNKALANGEIVSNMPEYKSLMRQLVRITETFPVPARWSYIAASGTNPLNSRLIVLTVDFNRADLKTIPGYYYDITPYPAMQRAIYGDNDITVSTVVWDNDYNFMTRSGFAKIRNEHGDMVGVLGVDIKTNYIVMRIISMVLFSLAGVGLVLLSGLSYAQGMGVLLSQAEYDKLVRK